MYILLLGTNNKYYCKRNIFWTYSYSHKIYRGKQIFKFTANENIISKTSFLLTNDHYKTKIKLKQHEKVKVYVWGADPTSVVGRLF